MTPLTLKQPKVFVMRPALDSQGNARWDWSWSAWREEARLIPETVAFSQRGAGTASFRVVRIEQAYGTVTTELRAGCYVCVTQKYTTTGSGSSAISAPTVDAETWVGCIDDIDEQPIGGYAAGSSNRIPDGFGSATASELGAALLERVRATNWRQIGGSGSPLPMTNTSTANLATGNKAIVGNAFKDPSNPRYLFARDLDQLGTTAAKVWTRWRVLTHLAEFCAPVGIPPMVIRCEDGSGLSGVNYAFSNLGGLAAWLDDASAPEVWDLDGLTISGVLDLIAASAVGLGWRIELQSISGTPKLAIVIYSRTSAASDYGPPKSGNPNGFANSRTLTTYGTQGERMMSVRVTSDGAEQYDEVTVQGAPITFCATLSPIDNNLEADWSTTQQTAYDAANDETRLRPEFSRVFSSFRLKKNDPQYGAKRSLTPGNGSGTAPVTPVVSWDGTTVDIDQSAGEDQYLPTFRFMDSLPWPRGWTPDGVTTSDADGVANDGPTKPRVWIYTAANQYWPIDTLNELASYSPIGETPAIDVSNAAPCLSVSYKYPHTLGEGTFAGDTAPELEPVAIYDWRRLLVTIGYQSTQRLGVTIRREYNGAEMGASTVRRSLIVRDDSLQFVAALSGTILSTEGDGLTTHYLGSDVEIRNDYPAAQKWAEELASWAFNPRDQVAATWALADGHGLRPGVMISSVNDENQQRQTDAIIAVVQVDYGAGTVSIQTETPPQPGRRGGATSSPQGGPVSVELGGTVAGVTQRQDARIAALETSVAARALIPAQSSGEPPALIIRVDDGLDIGTVIHWAGSAWEPGYVADGDGTLALVVAVDAVGPMAAMWGLTYLDPTELALTDHTDYWLVDGGTMTATKPATNAVLILRHYTNGVVVVRSGGGGVSVLDDLDDVDAPTPGDGDLLAWNDTTNKWEPNSPVAASLTMTGPAVIGKTGAGSGAAGDIIATVADRVLTFASSAIAWTQISTAMLADLAVTAAKIATGVITDSHIATGAAIAWAKISKTGSSLADLATRSAADLTSGTLPDARMPALTGDATSSVGTVSLTLASVVTAGGPTGSASVVPVITYDAKGRLTAVTTSTISIPWSAISSGKPTTLGGYGITDACTLYDSRLSDARTPLAHTHPVTDITGWPTTLAGYGITDAQPLDGDLTAIAALASNGYAKRTGTNAWTISAMIPFADLSGVCSSSDARLSDNRTPLDGSVTSAKLGANSVGTAAIAANAVTTATIATAAVTMVTMADLAGVSVIGRSANSTGVPAAIAAADGAVLNRVGATLAFSTTITLGLAATSYGSVKVNSSTSGTASEWELGGGANNELTAKYSGTTVLNIKGGSTQQIVLKNTSGTAGTTLQIDWSGNSPRIQMFRTDVSTSTPMVDINLASGTPGTWTTAKAMSIREIDVCDAGTAKKMLVLASAPY